MIKLSSRLEKLANYVEDQSYIVDIGCDHGLLDIYLIQNRTDMKIIASDINQNALNNAKKNIQKYHLESKITTVLSNGLDNIDTTSVDTIVIAGMGAHTIVGILYNNLKKIKKVKKIVLQSNNDLDFLRYKVTKIGYYIAKEELVEDAGIIYTIIEFRQGYRFYTKKQLYFGPSLLKENSKLFCQKCEIELKKLQQFYPMIPKNHYHHRRKTYWKIRKIQKILKLGKEKIL